jgi:hypothetical protein
MGKFGVKRTQRDITSSSGLVRAGFDAGTDAGAVGRALGGLAIAGGQVIQRQQQRKAAIEQKRQQMTDGNSSAMANNIRNASDESFKTFKSVNPQESWQAERERINKESSEAINKLPFSPTALASEDIRTKGWADLSGRKALGDATRQLQTDTIAVQVDAMTEAFRTGSAIDKATAATRYADLGANMGKDKAEVLADIKAAQAAGLKLRNEDAVEAIGNEAVSNPVATLEKSLMEQAARKEGKGLIPESELSDKDLVSAERIAKNRILEIERDSKEAVNKAQEGEENRLFEGLDDGTMTTADIVNSDILDVPAKRRLLDDEAQFTKMDLAKSWPLTDNDTVVQDLNTKLTDQSSGLTDINEMNKFINDAATSGKITKETRDKMRSNAKKGGLDAIDEQVNVSTLRVKNALVGRLTAREARFKVAELSRDLTSDEQRQARSVGFLSQVGLEQLNRFSAELNKRMRETGKETLSGVEVESLSAQVWDKYKKKDDAQKIREFMEFTGQRVPKPDGFSDSKWKSVSSATKADIVAASANGMTNKQIEDMIAK